MNLACFAYPPKKYTCHPSVIFSGNYGFCGEYGVFNPLK
jgi:hypothetical protein